MRAIVDKKVLSMACKARIGEVQIMDFLLVDYNGGSI